MTTGASAATVAATGFKFTKTHAYIGGAIMVALLLYYFYKKGDDDEQRSESNSTNVSRLPASIRELG